MCHCGDPHGLQLAPHILSEFGGVANLHLLKVLTVTLFLKREMIPCPQTILQTQIQTLTRHLSLQKIMGFYLRGSFWVRISKEKPIH